jgi:UDP-3-O-[3-hydroxymyristoyl] glucosamine N-acyltransferase
MTKPLFFKPACRLTIGDVAAMTEATPSPSARLYRIISNIASVDRAGPTDLVFFDNAAYLAQLRGCGAGACLVGARFEHEVPDHIAALRVGHPYRAFILVAQTLFPEAMRPSSLFSGNNIAANAAIHPAARLESGVTVEPGAVIGPQAEIGAGTIIGPTAVVGPHVRIGRDGVIGAGTTVTHALIGDRVVIHPGCRIGQDGFGYQMSARGHGKVPQLGRVIIQDDVEIGSNSTVDRGGLRDTVIGEGTKIDNLVQIGHNVSIGRHCVIVAQSGLSGSVTLEDWVMLGGQVGIADHLTIGEGAQIGASSGVMHDVPAGARWIGTPAKPAREQFREFAAVTRLARQRRTATGSAATDDAETEPVR